MKKLDVNLKILIAIITLFGLSIGLMAQAPQKKNQFHQQERERPGMQNLTDEQKAQIKEINLAEKKEVQPLKDELLINRAKINALVKKDNPDMKEIVSLVEANGKLITEIQVKSIESKVKVRALLDDEQKVLFDAHYGKMQKINAMARHYPQQGQFHGQARMQDRSRY